MASSEKTEFLELSKYTPSDIQTMSDVNEDHRRLDEWAKETDDDIRQLNENKANIDLDTTRIVELGKNAKSDSSAIDFHAPGTTGDIYDYDARIVVQRREGATSANQGKMRILAGDGIQFGNRIDSAIIPHSSATHNLGASGYLWDQVFARNGTINTSDENEKENVACLDSNQALSFVMALNPVSHRFKGRKRTHYGLIAQEVKEAMDANSISDMDFAGWIKSPVLNEEGNETGEYTYGLRYTEFIPLLLKVVQEQQKRIEALEAR